MKPPKIKTIIPTNREYFAAFLPDKENEIEGRIERIVCWSLIERMKPEDSDEVVGQIIDKETITEVSNVDEEEGFGLFLGYFESREIASTALMTAQAEEEEEDNDEDSDDESEDDDDDEGSEEDGDLSGSDDDEDWDDEDDDDEEDSDDDDSDDDDGDDDLDDDGDDDLDDDGDE